MALTNSQESNNTSFHKNQKISQSGSPLLSHTRRTLTIARNKRELFFFEGGSKREKLERRLDQDYLRLATQDKRPIKKGWTYDNWQEWLSKEQLLKKYGEWSLRGGKQLGNKYLSFLDVDIFKGDIAPTLQQRLEKNVRLCLDYLNCFHVKTKKGYHAYLLTDKPLTNEILYHTDKFGKRRIIGSIQSKGKYVVGFDSPNKKLVERGKWFWHVKDLEKAKESLRKFFIEIGKEKATIQEEKNKPPILKSKLLNNSVISKKVEYWGWDYNLNKLVDRSYKLVVEKSWKVAKKVSEKPPGQLASFRHNIQAKILSKQKTCLTDLWKVFYLDWKTKQQGYFLVNEYQQEREFNDLSIGSVRNMVLIQGIKHSFLNRVLA